MNSRPSDSPHGHFKSGEMRETPGKIPIDAAKQTCIQGRASRKSTSFASSTESYLGIDASSFTPKSGREIPDEFAGWLWWSWSAT